jgi:nucleotide-binding universal stress UspA family protein
MRRALLAYDGSPKSDEALFVATYVSLGWKIPLVVVTVIETTHAAPAAQARARDYLETRGVEATFVEESGAVAPTILRVGEQHGVDLVIMGGYGFNPVVEIVLGSSVDRVLRDSQKPVLICR